MISFSPTLESWGFRKLYFQKSMNGWAGERSLLHLPFVLLWNVRAGESLSSHPVQCSNLTDWEKQEDVYSRSQWSCSQGGHWPSSDPESVIFPDPEQLEYHTYIVYYTQSPWQWFSLIRYKEVDYHLGSTAKRQVTDHMTLTRWSLSLGENHILGSLV